MLYLINNLGNISYLSENNKCFFNNRLLFDFISIVLAIKMEISRRVVHDVESNIGRSLTHLLPQIQQIYNYMWINLSENWMNSNSTIKHEGQHLRWVGEVETQSYQKQINIKQQNPQTPQMQKSTNWKDHKNMKLFPQEQRAYVLIRYSNPQVLHRRQVPLNCLALDTKEDYIQENQQLKGKENLFLKGSCVESLTLGPMTKTQF